jgi:sugar/nucleoside kinase (ribokinase family)
MSEAKGTSAGTVLCVGTVAYDRIERPGHEPWEGLGGSAVFTAQASALFASTRLRSIIGPDFAAEDRAQLEALGLDLGGVEQHPSAATFRWGGGYKACLNERETILFEPGCLLDWKPAVTQADEACQGGLLLSSISPHQQRAFLESWNPARRPFCVVDTFDHWIERERENVEAVFAQADLLLLNQEEARLLIGEGSAVAQGTRLLERFSRAQGAIVKCGGDGATLCHREGQVSLGVVAGVKVLDGTGAGDAFAGALLGRLAQRGHYDFAAIREAMPWAAAAASFMIEGLGGACFPRDLAPVAVRRAMVR